MSRREAPAPWVLVAGGFHRKGGMDKANLALAEYLVELKKPVHIVCHSLDLEFSRHPLVTTHRVPRPAGSFLLGEPLLDLCGRVVARRITRQFPGASVVVNGGNCIWPAINWVHYVHHAWRPTGRAGPVWFRMKNAASEWLIRKREKLALRKARLLISNSNLTTRHIVEHFEIDPRRIRTVYLGAESEWGPVTPQDRASSRSSLGVPESRPLALFVGGLGYDQRKGFDVLFTSWRELCSRPDWDVDLLVAGSGSAMGMWQEKISQSGLANRIRLLGFSQQVQSLLAAADLLISPTRYEAYGLNVQEAICRGVPAMVSASAGVAERYGPEFAPMLLPDSEDAGDMVNRLLAWRQFKEEWLARFQPFSDTLRKKSWRDMAVEIVSLVQQQENGPAQIAFMTNLSTAGQR